MLEKNRQFGYFNALTDDVIVRQKEGQITGAGSIGILCLEDMWIPILPGNVMNGFTYKFPVQYQFVKGLHNRSLFAGDPSVYDGILEASRELIKYGVRAITGACGFFGNYQARLAADLDIPVALSSLIQLPWIAATLKPNQKIGVLVASGESCGPALLRSCGVPESLDERLVIKGLGHEANFSAIIENRGEFDNAVVKQEMLKKAMEILEEHPDVGAFLLECTEMPPYAHIIQAATQLPVFDYTSMLEWLNCALCRKPFAGFM